MGPILFENLKFFSPAKTALNKYGGHRVGLRWNQLFFGDTPKIFCVSWAHEFLRNPGILGFSHLNEDFCYPIYVAVDIPKKKNLTQPKDHEIKV